MKIRLPDGNTLLVLSGKSGVIGVFHSDFSEKVNLRKKVRDFFKSRGEHIITKSVEPPHNSPFWVLRERIITYLDALKFACWLTMPPENKKRVVIN